MHITASTLFALIAFICSVQGLPHELPQISKSGQLALQAINGIVEQGHPNVTIFCNDKKIKEKPKLTCEGKFEIEIKTEHKEEHTSLQVKCDGETTALNEHGEKTFLCIGKYVLVFIKETKVKKHETEEYHHTLKCSELYSMQRFDKGDALMNETCAGSLEEIEMNERKNKTSSYPILLDEEDDDVDATTCIAKCDGVRVQVDYPYPCQGVYQLSCSSHSSSVFTEECDGTYRQNQGTSCTGSFSTATTSQTNTVNKRCDNHFSSYKRRDRNGIRSRFDHCQGAYSYVTIRTGTKPKSSPKLLLE
eukprot:TRINITY_DN156_c0_g2_i1.p2 TRINITY_DN156_c0_g2~~TRINITY_DN156_c0_g2_i1.p2  ORF type:complete len:326 (-),score=23.93 TRINITY_DN156_c0_g2_i1:532-1446(-)